MQYQCSHAKLLLLCGSSLSLRISRLQILKYRLDTLNLRNSSLAMPMQQSFRPTHLEKSMETPLFQDPFLEIPPLLSNTDEELDTKLQSLDFPFSSADDAEIPTQSAPNSRGEQKLVEFCMHCHSAAKTSWPLLSFYLPKCSSCHCNSVLACKPCLVKK